MSEIQFPKNFEFYCKAGHLALENSDMNQAFSSFEKAYKINKDPLVNFMLSTISSQKGNIELAIQYAEEMLDNYLIDYQRFEYFLQLLLLNYQFEKARAWVWQGYKQQLITKEQVNDFSYVIDEQAQMFPEECTDDQLYSLDELLEELKAPVLVQIETIKKSENLSLADLIELGKQILSEDKVTLLARNYLFEELSKNEVDQVFDYLDLNDQIIELNPKTIGTDLRDQLMNDIIASLAEKLEHQDPYLLQNLIEEVYVEQALLYPLQVFYSDTAEWVNSYLSSDKNDDSEIKKIREKLKKWQSFYQS
ncbi:MULTISPECIES: tetratricopeptide repeat protein [Enterococcus]|uniref:Tetratricopeptide repeat protein n=1 Tax=Enterococcus alishanensis TaxID=1303817 RepID=A0ABS6TBU2_9ENTE|nr:hypothetical protein [Enterococcus alishanensis]MBV7390362.1 hypothetical protein [Enterococcus alishanensis]